MPEAFLAGKAAAQWGAVHVNARYPQSDSLSVRGKGSAGRPPAKASSLEQAVARSTTQSSAAELLSSRNPSTLLLSGIFVLLLFYTLYFTSQIALPVLFAFLLSLVLQPAMRAFAMLRVPKAIAALLIIGIFLGVLLALGLMVSGPAADWLAKAPDSLTRLEARLWFLRRPIAEIQNASQEIERLARGPAAPSTAVLEGPGLSGILFSGTRDMLTGLGTTVLLLFFLLVSGDLLLMRFVEVLPRLKDRTRVLAISQEIESSLSAYLGTITLMNAGVGVATGLVAYASGLSDPVLWGTLAFLLNYIPILGPLSGIIILFLVGLLTFDTIWRAVIPAGLYLAIHLLEGEMVTPMLLARRFVLNPVLVIISLVFWYWMWGVAGALLAIPLLAAAKIMCDRIGPLTGLGHFLGNGAKT